MNLVSSGILIFVLAPLKLLYWIKPFNEFLQKIFIAIGTFWVFINNLIFTTTKRTEWVVHNKDNEIQKLSPKNWYFIIANHQSAVDILVLQKILFGKTPFLKFFIKKELIWVPLLGQCWWLLGFPFLERGKKRKKRKDIKTVQRVTKKFKENPTALISFLEGTRLNDKRTNALSKSPYKTLLKPRAGGFGIVLETLGEKLNGKLVDVTIHYPGKHRGLVDLFLGKIKKIVVDVRVLSFSKDLIGAYESSEEAREKIYAYLEEVWSEKDKILLDLKKKHGA